MVDVDPEVIFQELMTHANAQQRKSLTILHKVLKKHCDKREANYSIAEIARRSVANGGPTASTIRNKHGFRFRQLIEAWAAKAGTTMKMPVNPLGRSTKMPADYELLKLIPDPAARACFCQILAERNRFKSELNLLKAQTSMVIDLRPLPKPPPRAASDTVQLLPAFVGVLNEMEIAALKSAILDEFFNMQGWRATAAGQVKDESGEVYKHGYVTAIKKILKEIG